MEVLTEGPGVPALGKQAHCRACSQECHVVLFNFAVREDRSTLTMCMHTH